MYVYVCMDKIAPYSSLSHSLRATPADPLFHPYLKSRGRKQKIAVQQSPYSAPQHCSHPNLPGPFSRGWRREPLLHRWSRSSLLPLHGSVSRTDTSSRCRRTDPSTPRLVELPRVNTVATGPSSPAPRPAPPELTRTTPGRSSPAPWTGGDAVELGRAAQP
jgi:hypothetical protein